MKSVPTVYPQKLVSKSPSLPTQRTTCSLPRKITFPDELLTFQQHDIIRTFQYLNESIAPVGFQFTEFKELDNCVLYFQLSIKVDEDFHVQLQCNGMPLPLPQWFVQGHNATLKKIRYLENFPAYIRNTVTDNNSELMNS